MSSEVLESVFDMVEKLFKKSIQNYDIEGDVRNERIIDKV